MGVLDLYHLIPTTFLSPLVDFRMSTRYFLRKDFGLTGSTGGFTSEIYSLTVDSGLGQKECSSLSPLTLLPLQITKKTQDTLHPVFGNISKLVTNNLQH